MSKIAVDPPEGWKYGFPKRLDREIHNQQHLVNFLIDHGYPKGMCEDINLKHTRMIEIPDGD